MVLLMDLVRWKIRKQNNIKIAQLDYSWLGVFLVYNYFQRFSNHKKQHIINTILPDKEQKNKDK